MRSYVEAVAVSFKRARNATDERRCLKDRDLPIPGGMLSWQGEGALPTGLLKKFISGRKPCRPRSNDNQFQGCRTERSAPVGNARPLIEPYVQFSRIRLSVWNP